MLRVRVGLVSRRVALSQVTVARIAVAVAVVPVLAGCSWFGGSKDPGKSVPVFDAKPGQCFTPPGEVHAQISELTVVPCNDPHTQEAYALVTYEPKAGAAQTGAYPGDAALKTFAEGACAQRYRSYVGIDYLDSKYFFTYLLPSARGWDQGHDRQVLCIVTTTGEKLKSSVKGTKA